MNHAPFQQRWWRSLQTHHSLLPLFLRLKKWGGVRGGHSRASEESVNPDTFPNADRKELISHINLLCFLNLPLVR